jgi:nitroimidazol reductase NimA-like FMN-containing flavoprotein (pyridoxamine 5'-phosphate oxidase superfamily)
MGPVSWDDETDDVLDGDITAALAYVTPAGCAVVTAVAPVGLRDRDAGTVGFTTSLGLGKKLERIRRNPRVALAYHAREHGFSRSARYVLVQGKASFDPQPDEATTDRIGERATRFMGPPRRGRFWDRWLREYYRERVPVDVAVERIVWWPDLRCEGEANVDGVPLPDEPPAAQPEPKNGTSPRLDSARAAKRLAALHHRLLGWVGGDGFPVIAPVDVDGGDERGMRVGFPGEPAPPGARRAGLLGHEYRAQLVGLSARQYTGWLDPGAGTYAPLTEQGFKAPANKTLLLLANGLLAKRGMRKARAAQTAG